MYVELNYRCDTCPYVKEDYNKRCDIYSKLDAELNNNEILFGLYCDKVGFKIGWYGACSDSIIYEENAVECSNLRKSTKRRRLIKHKNKLKRAVDYNYTTRCEENTNGDCYIIENAKVGKSFSRYLKKTSNKRVRQYNKRYIRSIELERQYKKQFGDNSQYKRVFDFKNEID